MKCPCEECLKLPICKSNRHKRNDCDESYCYLYPEYPNDYYYFHENDYWKHIIPRISRGIRFSRYMSIMKSRSFKDRLNDLFNWLKDYDRPITHRISTFFDFWFMEGLLIGYLAYDWVRYRLRINRIRDI